MTMGRNVRGRALAHHEVWRIPQPPAHSNPTPPPPQPTYHPPTTHHTAASPCLAGVMRLVFSFLATAVAVALALVAAAARADDDSIITVRDLLLDEGMAGAILAQHPDAANGKARIRDYMVDLPVDLYQRVLAVIEPNATATAVRNTQAPVRGEGQPIRAHKDKHADGNVVQGPTSLLYLEGDGRMVFRHDVTGAETAVDVKPGRLLVWPNHLYTHMMEAGRVPRRMVGPMVFRDNMLQSIGNPTGTHFIAQARAQPLFVEPGGVATLTMEFMVVAWRADWADQLEIQVGMGRKGKGKMER